MTNTRTHTISACISLYTYMIHTSMYICIHIYIYVIIIVTSLSISFTIPNRTPTSLLLTHSRCTAPLLLPRLFLTINTQFTTLTTHLQSFFYFPKRIRKSNTQKEKKWAARREEQRLTSDLMVLPSSPSSIRLSILFHLMVRLFRVLCVFLNSDHFRLMVFLLIGFCY